MKLRAFFVLLVLFAAAGALVRVYGLPPGFGGDELEGFAFGVGAEVNGIARRDIDFSLNGNVNIFYRFNEWGEFGNVFAYNTSRMSLTGESISTLTVVEDALALRFYFLRAWGAADYFYLFRETCHPFFQAGGGLSFTWDNAQGYTLPVVFGELGMRVHIVKMYIEPYIRVGYPMYFGGGLVMGLRFTRPYL